MLFAQEIVERFHDRRAADDALADFETRFRYGANPDDLQEMTIPCADRTIPIAQLLKQSGLTASTSESLRMIDQGGVRINGERVADRNLRISRDQTLVLQVGKRKFVRVVLV